MYTFKKIKNIEDLQERCSEIVSIDPPYLREIDVEDYEESFMGDIRDLVKSQMEQSGVLDKKPGLDIDKIKISRIYIPDCGNVNIK